MLQLINYIVEVDKEHRSYQEILNLIMSKISPKAGDEIMNLAEVWKEEGALNERLNIAKKFLAEGIDPVFVAKNTGLSLEQVKNIQKSLKK